jgi:hypothetical protein
MLSLTIKMLDINSHCLLFKTQRFSFRLQVVPTQLVSVDRASPCLRLEDRASSVGWHQLRGYHLKTKI